MKFQIMALFCAGLSIAGLSLAQTPLDAGLPGPGVGDFVFIASEMEFGQKLVTGAPYSAEATTERVQDLADGTRITQTSTAAMYRDSEGRTRRDSEFVAIGPWSVSEGEHPRTSFIHDPVAGIDYILEPETKTARKLKFPKDGKSLVTMAPSPSEQEDQIFIAPAPQPVSGIKQTFKFHKELPNARTESLGRRIMEGIPVDGTRSISVIETGKIGNDRPIQIVSEKWYSPDLQINIMTRYSDPRFGETTYQLTNIRRVDPDRSLFVVPSGYKTVDAPGPGKIVIRKEIKNQK